MATWCTKSLYTYELPVIGMKENRGSQSETYNTTRETFPRSKLFPPRQINAPTRNPRSGRQVRNINIYLLQANFIFELRTVRAAIYFNELQRMSFFWRRSVQCSLLIERRAVIIIFEISFCAGLGDAWGAAPPLNHPGEATIKELGSHLLQVSCSRGDYICFVWIFG